MTTVSDAIRTRTSVRVFNNKQVPKEVIQEMLELAGNSASNSNIEARKVYVLSGEPLKAMVAEITTGLYSGEDPDTPEYPAYPPKLQEPYRSRRYACGENMYAALEIPREDKTRRIQQVMKNYTFFGAPVGIIISMPANMLEGQVIDIGIYLQSLMLLANERGLATCAQASWAQCPNRVRAALNIADDERVMVGLALGYADEEQAVNTLDHPRAELADYVTLRGF